MATDGPKPIRLTVRESHAKLALVGDAGSLFVYGHDTIFAAGYKDGDEVVLTPAAVANTSDLLAPAPVFGCNTPAGCDGTGNPKGCTAHHCYSQHRIDTDGNHYPDTAPAPQPAQPPVDADLDGIGRHDEACPAMNGKACDCGFVRGPVAHVNGYVRSVVDGRARLHLDEQPVAWKGAKHGDEVSVLVFKEGRPHTAPADSLARPVVVLTADAPEDVDVGDVLATVSETAKGMQEPLELTDAIDALESVVRDYDSGALDEGMSANDDRQFLKWFRELVELRSVRDAYKAALERPCPITGRQFFMVIEHPNLGPVATYGGPYDSYTVPVLGDDGHWMQERYDHDEGGWVDGAETIDVGLIKGDPDAVPA